MNNQTKNRTQQNSQQKRNAGPFGHQLGLIFNGAKKVSVWCSMSARQEFRTFFEPPDLVP
jgi:hypothetical protein